jgi:hypothetical protein
MSAAGKGTSGNLPDVEKGNTREHVAKMLDTCGTFY